jgi:hypothetical protein
VLVIRESHCDGPHERKKASSTAMKSLGPKTDQAISSKCVGKMSQAIVRLGHVIGHDDRECPLLTFHN